MLNLIPPRLLVAAVLAIATGAHAAPMHKCVDAGRVTYQQAPCAANQASERPTVEDLNNAARQRRAAAASAPAATGTPAASSTPSASGSRCDGRQRCVQMRSCAEAKYFLAHCPGVQMDGDGDGIPCEEQWCKP